MGFTFNFNTATQEQREEVFWAIWDLSGVENLWADLGAESEADFIENKPFKKQREAVRRFEQLVLQQPINTIQELAFQKILLGVGKRWKGIEKYREGNVLTEEDLDNICGEIQDEIGGFENAFRDIDFTPIQEKLEAHFKITPEILAKRREELDAWFKPVLEALRKEPKKVLKFDSTKRKPK